MIHLFYRHPKMKTPPVTDGSMWSTTKGAGRRGKAGHSPPFRVMPTVLGSPIHCNGIGLPSYIFPFPGTWPRGTGQGRNYHEKSRCYPGQRQRSACGGKGHRHVGGIRRAHGGPRLLRSSHPRRGPGICLDARKNGFGAIIAAAVWPPTWPGRCAPTPHCR